MQQLGRALIWLNQPTIVLRGIQGPQGQLQPQDSWGDRYCLENISLHWHPAPQLLQGEGRAWPVCCDENKSLCGGVGGISSNYWTKEVPSESLGESDFFFKELMILESLKLKSYKKRRIF